METQKKKAFAGNVYIVGIVLVQSAALYIA